MAPGDALDGWKFSTRAPGGLCAVMAGIWRRHMSCAGSLGVAGQCLPPWVPILVHALERFSWTMCTALVRRATWPCASMMSGSLTSAVRRRMLEPSAQVRGLCVIWMTLKEWVITETEQSACGPIQQWWWLPLFTLTGSLMTTSSLPGKADSSHFYIPFLALVLDS